MIERFIMKLWILIAMAALSASSMASLAPLKPKGMQMVDPNGKPVSLKGVNLGNWLMIEMWMLGLSGRPGEPEDQFELEAMLTKRFGEKEKDRLMDVYRSHWITGADFKQMRTFGFNVVRLPMNYRLMEDDRQPFQLKSNAWRWIDAAVDMAEANGLYVILDMHGAQGGQSPYDHTGHSGQNRLKDDETAQKRLAWLWGELAKRYRKRGAVIAYDVFNEPYGMPKPIQVKVFKMALTEIRKNDPDKLVIASGNYDDFDHYGDPKENGWKNVGFQMHYYPGLFGGGPPSIPTHVRHLEYLKTLSERTKKLNVPFLIGEMNVVFDSAGGASMMKRYYDTHAKYGWMTTMWSWKVVSDEGGIGAAFWGCMANKNPKRTVSFAKATAKQIEAYFKKFGSEPWVANVKLRNALTSTKPLPALPKPPPKRTTAPRGELPGWQLSEIGGAMPGGLKDFGSGRFEMYGGGEDVWGAKDQATFLSRRAEGPFELEVQIDAVEYVDTYTKAGLMLRASEEPDAAAVLLTTFPNGEIQLAHREAKGAEMQGSETRRITLAGLRLKLVRKDGSIEAWYAEKGKGWRSFGKVADKLPSSIRAGVVALSHEPTQLARFLYRGLRIR